VVVAAELVIGGGASAQVKQAIASEAQARAALDTANQKPVWVGAPVPVVFEPGVRGASFTEVRRGLASGDPVITEATADHTSSGRMP